MDSNLLNLVLQTAGPSIMQQLGSKVGLSQSQASTAVQFLMPVVSKAIAGNSVSPNGLSSLLGALTQGNHQQYVENPETLASDDTIADGNGILGHIFGSKHTSRAKAQEVADETGLPFDALKKALPLVASLAMGGLSKAQAQNQAQPQSQDFGSQIGNLLGSVAESGALGNILSSVLK